MLHRIGSLCSKYLRTNGPRLRYGSCPNPAAGGDCSGAIAGWSPVWFARSQANLASSVGKTFNSTNGSSTSPNRFLLAFGVASLLKFLGMSEPDEDSELIQIIKKAEVAFLKKEYNKSEQMFHLALKLAQELHNENGVTFIYDRLANVAFDTGRFEKARRLFVEVIQRLLDRGMEKDDLAMIHISFKLAKIFESIGDYGTAAIGFQYCLEMLRPKLAKENEDYADALALWLMLLTGYAYFLHYVGRPDEAFKYFEEARSVREQVGGEHDEQLVLLLNNLGTVSKIRGDTEAALRYFHEAEKLGKSFADMEKFSFVYLNLAYLYMELKMADRAREYCQRALNNASRHEFPEGVKESQECLSKVKEALSTAKETPDK